MNPSIEELLCRLIKFESTSYNEGPIVEYISDYLDKLYIKHILDYFSPYSYNENAKKASTANLYINFGKNKEDVLIFYFHLDIVEAKNHLFKPIKKNNKIYGRGTADMKSALAGILSLLLHKGREIEAEFIKSDKSLLIIFISDEETTGTGIKRFIEWYSDVYSKSKNPVCILFEPSNDFKNIIIGCRGYTFLELSGLNSNVITTLQELLQFKEESFGIFEDRKDGFGAATLEITKITVDNDEIEKKYFKQVNGISCHASRPFLGINPIENALKKNKNIKICISDDNDAINSIPSFCHFSDNPKFRNSRAIANIDIRTNLFTEESKLKNEIIELLKKNHCKVKILREGKAFISKKDKLIRLCRNNIENVIVSENITPIISYGGNDAEQLLNLSNNVIASFGPGEISVCHSDNEYIALSSLKKTPSILFTIIDNYLNQKIWNY